MYKVAIKLGDSYSKEKRNYLGSARIRGHWLAKYWKQCDDFFYPEEFPKYKDDFFNPINQMKILEDYDVVILNKTYEFKLAEMLRRVGKIVIVDMCDPDHLSSHSNEGRKNDCLATLKWASAVVVNGKAMKKSVSEVYKGIIKIIPDRIDIYGVENKKVYYNDYVRSIVWYGYSENLRVLEPYLKRIINMGIEITIISDAFFDNIILVGCKYNPKEMITFKVWHPETVNDEIIKHDIVFIGRDKNKYLSKFKSNNRAMTAYSLGMPVAYDIKDLKKLESRDARLLNVVMGEKLLKQEFDIKKSVGEYKELINKLFWRQPVAERSVRL